MLWNSLPTGLGDSRATIRSASLVGRPDLTERTMTSMAGAKFSVNFFLRRLVRNPRIQRGRPRPTTKAAITITRGV